MKARALPLLAALALAACASGGGSEFSSADAASAARIRDGMERLGASEERRDCFARRLATTLDGEEEDEAAEIVERAENKDQMRESVLSASGPVRQAFIGANFGCSLSG